MKQYIKNNLLAVALVMAGGVCAMAQQPVYEAETSTKVDSIALHYYTKYHSNFLDNWSVDLMGSARVLFAEEDGNLGFGKRIQPAFQANLQKDMTPDVSFRLSFAVGALKGWNTGSAGIYKWQSGWVDDKVNSAGVVVPDENGSYADPVRNYLVANGTDCSNGYEQNIRYYTFGADVMLNLWNLWTTNNQLDRKWTPYLFAGVEYFQMLKYHGYYRTYKIGGHVGFKCDYRLSRRIAVTGEIGGALHSATFDNEIGKGNHVDYYNYASLGVKIKLGKQGYRQDRVLPTGEYVRLGNMATSIKEQYEVPGGKAIIIGNLFAPSVVFDDNADTYSEELQMANISRMAQYIKDNPGLKISVIGNTSKVGADLAKRRADIVRQVLIDRYGIDGSRLVSTTLDVNKEYSVKGSDQTVNFGVTK